MRLFYATDIHGSDLCFRKCLRAMNSSKHADVVIIGGDITGKWLVPIVSIANGAWRSEFAGATHEFRDEADVQRWEVRLAEVGAYGWRCDLDTARQIDASDAFAEELLREARIARLRQWVDLADQKLAGSTKRMIMNAGNDDPFYIDAVLNSGDRLECPEGRVLELADGVSIVSVGYANTTPWTCPRDVPEEDLASRIDEVVDQVGDMDRCIFNLHAPPHGTQLDLAIGLDADLRPSMSIGADEMHVGSVAVRSAIEKYQPLLALHGHIHEQHAFIRLGRTICVNPGSEYHVGQLRGFYAEIERGDIRRFGLTREEIA